MARNSWLESVYNLADYYYWEPEHLGKMTRPDCKGKVCMEKIFRSIRSTEVPLNKCFNIMMRVLPDRIIAAVLEQASFTKPIDLNSVCSYVDFMEEIGNVDDFIQPDTVLESIQTRIYIELKLNANIEMKQITKYLYFHEEWNRRQNQNKDMVLLILTSKGLKASFNSKERELVFAEDGLKEIESLGSYLNGYDTAQHGIGNGVDFSHLDEQVFKLRSTVNLARMTWLDLADQLEKHASGDLEKLIQDFVADIRAR